MKSVGSRPSRSQDYGREHREQGKKRVLQVATTGVADSGGFSRHRIRLYAMAEIKEFYTVAELHSSLSQRKN